MELASELFYGSIPAHSADANAMSFRADVMLGSRQDAIPPPIGS